MAWIVVLLLLGGLVFLYISTHNGIVAKRNQADNAWSQIDVQLQRKTSLIPNLLETVKGFMKHESDVLVQVAEARAALVNARGPREAAAADQTLKSSLNTLFLMVDEKYPDLKAHAGFDHLREELISSENRIAYARQAYSDAVTRYHNALDSFPGSMIAGTKFQRKELFQVAAQDRQAADDLAIKF